MTSKQEWPKQRLGEVADLCLGKMLDKKKNRGELHPYLGNIHVRWGRFDLNDLPEMRFEEHEHDRYGLKRGDLVVCEGGEPGRCALWNDQVPNMKIQKALHRVRPHSCLDSRYLLYWFLWAGQRSYFDQFFTGATIKHLPGEKLAKVEIDVPDLPTQRKIAGILSAYDDLIENNLRRIRILEEMAQSLYREWFVHFRFPGHESSPMVDSPLGPIPEGWEVRTVEDAVKRFPVGKKYSNKTVNETGAVPVLDQGKSGIIGYHDDEPGFKASEENPVIVFANHTCYQRIIQYPFSAIQNVLPFRSNSALERNLYWLHWATKDVIEFNDYKGHWPEFIAKKLIIPPTEVCDAFGKIAETSIRSIYCLERRNQTLRQTRDLLLPKLLSGSTENQPEEALA